MSGGRSHLPSALRRLHRDERGVTLPELLVGVVIAGVILNATLSIVFATDRVQKAAGGRAKVAAELAALSTWFDRDAATATRDAPASSLLSGHTTEDCTLRPMDLGFQEGGASVRYQTVASTGSQGPYVLQRVSGSGTLVLLRYVTSCSWAPQGKVLWLSLCFLPPNAAVECPSLYGAPRTW